MDFHMSYDCKQENNDENNDEDAEIFIKTQQPVSQSNNTTSPDENVADNIGKKNDHPQSQCLRSGKYSKASKSSTNKLTPIVDSHDFIQNRKYLGDMSNKANEYDSQAAATQGATSTYLSLRPINELLMVNTPASNNVLRPAADPHDIRRKRTYLGDMLNKTNEYDSQATETQGAIPKYLSLSPISELLMVNTPASNRVLRPTGDEHPISRKRTYLGDMSNRANQYSWQAAAPEGEVSKSFLQPITQSLLPETSIFNSGTRGNVFKCADDPQDFSQNRTDLANIPSRTNLYGGQASAADSPMSQSLTEPTSASNSSAGCSLMRPAADPLDTSRKRPYLGAMSKRINLHSKQAKAADGAVAKNYSPRPISQSLPVSTSVFNSGADCSVLSHVWDISPNGTNLDNTSKRTIQCDWRVNMAHHAKSLMVQSASDSGAGSSVLKPANDQHDRNQNRAQLDDTAYRRMYDNVLPTISQSPASASSSDVGCGSLTPRNTSTPIRQPLTLSRSIPNFGSGYSIVTPANDPYDILLHQSFLGINDDKWLADIVYHALYDVSPTSISQSQWHTSASNSSDHGSSLSPANDQHDLI